MKKRLIGMAMAAVLAMTALTGCGTTEDTSSLDSLTFTHVTSPLNLPSIVEKEEGIYISFELELKGPCDKSDEEMYQMILTEILKSNPKYFIEMMVDRNFISGKVYGKSGIEHPAE